MNEDGLVNTYNPQAMRCVVCCCVIVNVNVHILAHGKSKFDHHGKNVHCVSLFIWWSILSMMHGSPLM
jgi:hypothetical protein